MEELLSFLCAKMRIVVAEDELNCVEKVTFARTISSNNNIVPWAKGLDSYLVTIGPEALDDNLWWEVKLVKMAEPSLLKIFTRETYLLYVHVDVKLVISILYVYWSE